MFSVDIKDKRALKAMRELPDRVNFGLIAAFTVEAESIIGDAKELVPVDTGNLKSSGFVDEPVETDNFVMIQAGFGGVAADYALEVHERTENFHPSGQAKYLEEPFNAHIAGMDERVAKIIRAVLVLPT